MKTEKIICCLLASSQCNLENKIVTIIYLMVFSPNGRKFRSKPELMRFLGSSYDLTNFDYRSGKFVSDKTKLNRRTKPYEPKVSLQKSVLLSN